jgi:pimeloyl-ACP methyl ester carboxylesterase
MATGERSDRQWLRPVGYVIAIVLIWAALAYGGSALHALHILKPKVPPFDLRTAGQPCIDAPDWTCGSITVPLDRNAPGGATLSIQFRVLPREFTNIGSAGMIVVVAGGPGQAAKLQTEWARSAFGPLLTDHDLLLVDNRGTGSSEAIDCPLLQEEQPFASDRAIAECRQVLGPAADDYGTVNAVDDLGAVLTRLHALRVDMYAESYGPFFAQVFAIRHPQYLHSLVLDGAYPVAVDPWSRERLLTALAALRMVCSVEPICQEGPDLPSQLETVVDRLRAGQLHGRASDALGDLRDVTPSVSDLVFALDEAGRDESAFRELPAALAAATRQPPDLTPLLRLIAERRRPFLGHSRTNPTDVSEFSVGLLVADTCVDYPHPFTLTDALQAQTSELAQARQAFVDSQSLSLDPFTADEATPHETSCLGWPAPPFPVPIIDAHARFPMVPTLVLGGALDTITPSDGGRLVAHEFPHGHFANVPFVGHVTAFADRTGCAATMARGFVATQVVDTSCFQRIEPPAQVEAFPLIRSEEPPAHDELSSVHAPPSLDDQRTLGLVRDTVADVLWRWSRVGILSGHGLRGGSFTASAGLGPHTVTLQLDGVRWALDASVTGTLHVDASGAVTGSLEVRYVGGHGSLQVQLGLFSHHPLLGLAGQIQNRLVNVLLDLPAPV